MKKNTFDYFLSSPLKELGLLKFELLTSGLRVSQAAKSYIIGAKNPIRTRSGSSGGLDIILPNNIHVNVPINEQFASQSQLTLDTTSAGLVIKRNGEIETSVTLQPSPSFYSLETTDGIPMSKIGQMCSGDRFCYGMTGPYCWFWKRERRCKYCSIGLNKPEDASKKTINQLLESLSQAINDPLIPAKHILIGGGTPEGEDMGAILAAKICKVIKKHFDLSCYVMISAPLKNEFIDLLVDSGADELGMNIEFFSDQAWAEFIPGKEKYIGKQRYFEALEYAVHKIGPINTRSILITGLEKPEDTINGAEFLASIGVMPILSHFRPLAGTQLENKQGFDHITNWEIYIETHLRVSKYNIPTGPTCIACQNNTLALPIPGEHYRFY